MTERNDTGVIRLNTLDDFIEHTGELINQTSRELTVLSTDLDRDWLGNEALTTALRQFAISNRRSTVRILISEPTPVVKGRHAWLDLIKRLSRIEIRVIKPEILDAEPMKGTFVLSDRSGLVYRNSETGYTGFAHYDDRATVRQQLDVFEQYWRYSDESPEFRHLAL
ncbi:hypothetical protein [Saccharospirillum impatiens]|uniref:DUF7931 domain-containing protein n=1 Tax=Saccharospirillum impatiens TaxID=169438 RepID=UPI00041D9931|nr:hypothetical protein [Saccharospirillum impatiens]